MNRDRRRLFLMISTALCVPKSALASSCGMADFRAIAEPASRRVQRGLIKAAVKGVATGVVLAVGVSLLLPAAGLGVVAFAAGAAIRGGIEIFRTNMNTVNQLENAVSEINLE